MRGQDYLNDGLAGGFNYEAKAGDGISTTFGPSTLGMAVFNAFVLMRAEAASKDDIDTINTELAPADLASVDKALHRATKSAKAGEKDAIALKATLDKIQPHLAEGKPVRTVKLTPEDYVQLKQLPLLTAKPTMYVANVIEGGFDNNPLLDKVKAFAQAEGAGVVVICAKIEAEIADLDEADPSPVSSVESSRALFYRGKAAYLVGRVHGDWGSAPVVLRAAGMAAVLLVLMALVLIRIWPCSNPEELPKS